MPKFRMNFDHKTGTLPTRDDVYYFQNVIFQVGNTLFQVPKNAFNIPGTVFEAMFSLPFTADAEGAADENPIVLEVDENDFRGFLRVICGPRGKKVADEDWLAALELATMWTFEDIRQEAIQALDGWVRSQSLKQVVLAAKKYNIASWLQIAYSQLALQVPMPFDQLIEHPALDWETIARLLYAQQCILRDGAKGMTKKCTRCRTGEFCCGFIVAQVQSLFKTELESMKETHFEEPDLGPAQEKRGDQALM